MCDLCEKAKNSRQYEQYISKMLEEDKSRLEYTKVMAGALPSLAAYSSMNWPIKFVYPMFEARTAYAVPNNYFQNIVLDGERLGNSFAHGAMRSIFFVGERLVVFSKAVNFKDGKEFFTSFLLIHLDKNEYTIEGGMGNELGETVTITSRIEKPMMNLITGKAEKKQIAFSFNHQKVEGRIVSKDHVLSSARFKSVYEKYGSTQIKSGSMDMEGYAITVPHFSPHPYMLQLHEDFGYSDNKELQLHVMDYWRTHLAK